MIFLRRLVPGGADRSYGLHVARLAGLPARLIELAEVVMARLTAERASPAPRPQVVHESPVADPAGQAVLRELLAVDVANLTPVQALVALNGWQGRLRARPQTEANAGMETDKPQPDPGLI